MKNIVVSTFVLVTLFTYGCEDSVSKNMKDKDRKIVSLNKKVTEEINKQIKNKKLTVLKKQPELQTLAKLTDRKETAFEKPKNNVKTIQTKLENNSELTALSLDSLPLDLTVPLNIPSAGKLSYAKKNQAKRFLPDLFNGQKDKENRSVELVGKLIKSEEEGLGKDKSADGAGIDFKLTH